VYVAGLQDSKINETCEEARSAIALGLQLVADILERNGEAFDQPFMASQFMASTD
jgi:hypothetical protein